MTNSNNEREIMIENERNDRVDYYSNLGLSTYVRKTSNEEV